MHPADRLRHRLMQALCGQKSFNTLGGSMSKYLWRYMDYAKFMQLLNQKSLYFCGASNFEDPFEGQYAWGDKGESKFLETQKKLHLKHGDRGRMDFTFFMAMNLKTLNDLSKFTYVNCWHQSEHESEAMWKLYCKNPAEGVLIKTSIEELQRELKSVKDQKLQLKPVKYVKNYWIKHYNPEADVYFHKRMSFEHEKEFRAIIQHDPWEQGAIAKHGQGVPVNLDNLIKEVRVSPLSNNVFKYLVEMSLKQHLPSKRVTKSEIELQPNLQVIEQSLPSDEGFKKVAIKLQGKFA